MRRLLAARGTSAAAVGLCVALAAGGGYALASGGGGKTITVCVSHKGGTLYKAKHCAKHDKKLSWNKQGPQGIQGIQGIQGNQGNTGPQGPGAGYLVYDATGTASPTDTPIGTLGPFTFTGSCLSSAGTTTATIKVTGPGGRADGFLVNGNTIQAGSGPFPLQTGSTFIGGSNSTASNEVAVGNLLMIPTSGKALNFQQTLQVVGSSTNTCHWSATATPTAAGGVAAAAPAAASPQAWSGESGPAKGLRMLGGFIR